MRLVPLLIFVLGLLACESGKPESSAPSDAGSDPDTAVPVDAQRMSLEQLQDPETCKTCHPKQYGEWSRSMHAYASKDPVFIAMNQRGQRETGGSLGKFCVQCHAPMAVNKGLTTDGLNLASLPQSVQGVTCYFCHNTSAVGSDHFNANLTLANDTTMRGSIKDAHDPGVHAVAYSPAHDSLKMDSSYLCGTCHDVVTQQGTHIEQTLAEYKTSFTSIERNPPAMGGESCQGCHMPARPGMDYIADVPSSYGLKKRALHDHSSAAVDLALSDDFGDAGTRALQRQATEYALTTGPFVYELLNDGLGGFQISIETNAGHKQPSGTAQDRRLWLEVIAYDAQNNVLFQSGVIGDQDVEEYDLTDPKYDPQLCMFRDRFRDDAGVETHMFWQAASVEGKVLPAQTDKLTPHTAVCTYKTPGRQQPARLTMRMLMRPIGMDVLQDLIDSGDLDASIKAKVPTLQVQNTVIEWTADQGGGLPMPQSKLPPLYPP